MYVGTHMANAIWNPIRSKFEVYLGGKVGGLELYTIRIVMFDQCARNIHTKHIAVR